MENEEGGGEKKEKMRVTKKILDDENKRVGFGGGEREREREKETRRE